MSESVSNDEPEEIDDPGRDPKGLDPPRNLFGGGASPESDRGELKGTPEIEGEPEAPQEEDEPEADDDRG